MILIICEAQVGKREVLTVPADPPRKSPSPCTRWMGSRELALYGPVVRHI